MTEEWFEERIRQEETFNPEHKTTKQILEDHLDDEPSKTQLEAINERIVEKEAEKFDNSVKTPSAVDIDEKMIEREPKRDSGAKVRVSGQLVDIDKVKGTFRHPNGNIYAQGEKGKMLGVLDE